MRYLTILAGAAVGYYSAALLTKLIFEVDLIPTQERSQ